MMENRRGLVSYFPFFPQHFYPGLSLATASSELGETLALNHCLYLSARALGGIHAAAVGRFCHDALFVFQT